MALVDTSAEPDGILLRAKYRVLTAFVRRYGFPFALVKAEIADVMFGARTLGERPELLRDFTRTVNGYPRDGVARAALAVLVKSTPVLHRLGAVTAPTLVVCGRQDRATIPARSEAIAAKITGSRLAWIEESGHMSPIERPEAFNALIGPFVRENLARHGDPAHGGKAVARS